jgi:hypothetical protein
VEHETGIEILVGIAAGVGTAALVRFAKWAWKAWKTLRSAQSNNQPSMQPKVEPSLVIEMVRDLLPDGGIRTLKRSDVRGPVDVQVVEKQGEVWFAELVSRI